MLSQPCLRHGTLARQWAGLLTLAALLLTGYDAQAQLANAPWPKFGQNARNSGQSPFGGVGASWQAADLGSAQTGPAIGADGTVYISAGSFFSPTLYALDPLTGLIQWEFAPSDFTIRSQQPIIANGSVYIAGETNSSDGILYALDTDTGTEQWSFPVQGQDLVSTPAVAAGGTVYVHAIDNDFVEGTLYAVDPTTGTEDWSLDVSNARSELTVAGDGTIYIANEDGEVIAVDPDTELASPVANLSGSLTAPALSGGTIYVAGSSSVYAVSTSGELLWEAVTDEFSITAPVVSGGTVYVGTGGEVDGAVYAFDAQTGDLLWERGGLGPVVEPPAVANGAVYAGHDFSQLQVLDPSDGSTIWSFTPGGSFSESLAIAGDGTVYLGTSGGVFSVVGPIAEVAPSTLDFGPVAVADTLRQFYVTENTGDADLIIEDITISGPDAGSFNLVPGSVPVSFGEATTNTEGMTLIGPGLAVAQDVEFVPTTAGLKTAILNVQTNVGTETVDLVGIGDAVPPVANIDPVSVITARRATLNGQVSPGGAETTVVFEFTAVGSSVLQTVTAPESPLTGSETQPVSALISNLMPGTEYAVRMVATNSAGNDVSGEERFTTQLAPPRGETEPPSEVTATGATLQGTVDPGGAETAVTFEYFPTDAPEAIEIAIAAESPLTGAGEQAVSAAIDGLTQGTAYTVRVVAENEVGRATGEDVTFATPGPELDVTPVALAFGEVAVGSVSGPQPVAIGNTGGAPLTVTTVQVTGGPGFAISGDTGETLVAPGATRTVEVTFGPDELGAQSGELIVETEGAGTQAVALSGTGVTLQVAVRPAALAFGAVARGTTATETVQIENTGSGTLEVGPVAVSGPDAAQFAVPSGGVPEAVPPGATRALEVEYTPSSVGAAAAVLTVETNAGAETIALSGEGVDAPAVTTEPPAGVTATTAELRGTVDPGGAETTVVFEYVPLGQLDATETIVAVESPLTGTGEQAVSAAVEGLAPGTTYAVRVVAENSAARTEGTDRTFTTQAVGPTAETGAPTDVGQRQAVLRGTVNPGGAETTITFEYFPSETPEAVQVVTAAESPLAGTTARAVSAAVDGLAPGTAYTVRVVAENEVGRTAGADVTFTTQVGVPTAATDPPSEVSTETATLAGRVNPSGAETAVTFEYGLTPSYGQVAVATESPLTGAGEQAVSAAVEALTPGTTYHYRVVAENSAGRAEGDDQTFTTRAPVLRVTPTALRFGQLGVQDTSATQRVTIENIGDAVLTVETAALRDGTHFAASGDTGAASIEPGGTRTIDVAFAPTSDGLQQTALDVASDGGDAAVDLSGTGVALQVPVAPSITVSGDPEEITVSASDDFQPESGTLYYRPGGARTYRQVDLTARTQREFIAAIPAEDITERGVDLYAELTDGSLTVTFPARNPVERPLHLRTETASLPSGGTFAPETYRMISVPVLPEDSGLEAVLDEYGDYDPRRWRLLRWDPQAGDGGSYRELEASRALPALSTTTVAPGAAFWLITQDGESFAVDNAQSVDGSAEFQIQLQPGYNQIATPFAFPVSWNEAAVPAGVDAPREAQPPYQTTAVLEPWQGYWVFNRNATPVQVTVPPVEAASTEGAAAARATSTLPFERPPAYALQMVATLRQTAQGDAPGLYDRQNYVGWDAEATAQFGPEDVPEVPPIGPHVRLSIVEDGARLAGSLRPAGTDGQVWSVDVSAAVQEPFFQTKTVTVALRDHGTRPDGHLLRILDLDSGREVRVRNSQFSVSLTSDQPTRRLQVVLGTAAFVESMLDAVLPRATALGPSYPNPARGPISVEYQLERDERVEITVFDVLGRRIHQLVDGHQPAGRYTARWDGRGASGTPVASGMYFVRMQAGAFTDTRRVVLVR
jgi:outer membrane protein assembly factor BamB